MQWERAKDIQIRIIELKHKLELEYIDPRRLYCFRSYGSSSRARARIWSLPTVWQLALNVRSGYVIEVLAEKFDHLAYDEQTKILIHELLHIPRTFSGALRPHNGRYLKVNDQMVEKFFRQYKIGNS